MSLSFEPCGFPRDHTIENFFEIPPGAPRRVYLNRKHFRFVRYRMSKLSGYGRGGHWKKPGGRPRKAWLKAFEGSQILWYVTWERFLPKRDEGISSYEFLIGGWWAVLEWRQIRLYPEYLLNHSNGSFVKMLPQNTLPAKKGGVVEIRLLRQQDCQIVGEARLGFAAPGSLIQRTDTRIYVTHHVIIWGLHVRFCPYFCGGNGSSSQHDKFCELNLVDVLPRAFFALIPSFAKQAENLPDVNLE